MGIEGNATRDESSIDPGFFAVGCPYQYKVALEMVLFEGENLGWMR